MKLETYPWLFVLTLACLELTGCAVVTGIFKAGVWVGVLSVFAVLGLIAFGISKAMRR